MVTGGELDGYFPGIEDELPGEDIGGPIGPDMGGAFTVPPSAAPPPEPNMEAMLSTAFEPAPMIFSPREEKPLLRVSATFGAPAFG